MQKVIGALRLIFGTFVMGVYVSIWMVLLVPLLPWRSLRIKACNVFGKVTGRSMVFLSGSWVSVEGREHFDSARPAVYVSNHTSIIDLFLGMWMAPMGTVGIAKKEVVYYPFLGQLYLLSGHLRIDRGNSQKAVASLRMLADLVRKKHLSIWMWPAISIAPVYRFVQAGRDTFIWSIRLCFGMSLPR